MVVMMMTMMISMMMTMTIFDNFRRRQKAASSYPTATRTRQDDKRWEDYRYKLDYSLKSIQEN
jgi:uncharacterized protein YlxW (UPF0749 family)